MRDHMFVCAALGCGYGSVNPVVLYHHLLETHQWTMSAAWNAVKAMERWAAPADSAITQPPAASSPLTPHGLFEMESSARTMLEAAQDCVADLRRDLLAEERLIRTLQNLLGVS